MESVLLDLSHPSTWGLLIVSLLCLVYQGWWILPYTRLFPVEVMSAIKVDDQRMIRIITANVLTPNRNAEALIEVVHENSPDILVTLESDSWYRLQAQNIIARVRRDLDNAVDRIFPEKLGHGEDLSRDPIQ